MPVAKSATFMTYPITKYTAENAHSSAKRQPCFVRKVLRRMCHRGTPVSAAASSTTYRKRVRLIPRHPRLFLSRTSCRSTRLRTGEPVGFASKRFTANGYTTRRMLKVGSALRAIPSSVPSARALFKKYGGNTKRYFGTSARSAPRSWSNRTSGTAFAARRKRASSSVSLFRVASSTAASSGNTRALSAASLSEATSEPN
mmetsp:Transcript_5661/g.24027  ORF Transcript_5661/g.24027 Transcript_5661/m.24027 type:complete len:200 (-) Transcript_5661:1445-2044(-)